MIDVIAYPPIFGGAAWKALIEEEFGDGIMSAIDFDLDLSRLPREKGDRVQLVMSGKFLPYRYYGAEQGIPENGYKEVDLTRSRAVVSQNEPALPSILCSITLSLQRG